MRTTGEIETADSALISAAVGGSTDAFEALYRRHHRRVHAVVWRILGGSDSRADDLTQETFIRVWRALSTFRGDSAFTTWLHRLAVNTALMHLRQHARWDSSQDEETAWKLESGAAPTINESIDLERLIARLPPRARAVLILHDVEGWTHEDIASELGMASGSSKSQLHRARGLLKTWLGGNVHD